jgi:arylsulfatase A-like enzyme
MTTMLRAAALAALLPSLVLGCKSDKKAPAGGGSAGSGAVAQPDQPETPKPGKPPAKAPDRGPERLAYSLVDNRLAAHVTRGGGLFIVGGSNGFAKYARFGNLRKTKTTAWKLRQSQGDVKVAVMTGGSAKLDVPVTEAQLAGEPVVRVRAYSETARPFAIRVNGNPDVTGQLEVGWTTLELKAPAGQWKAGENELLFFTRGGGVAIDWLQIGGSAPGDGATAFYDGGAQALVLPEGGGLSYFVQVPASGRLTGDLADGACEVAVKATAADGAGLDGKLAGLGSAVDLTSLAGKAVRLDLIGRGCPSAKLTKAALVVPGEVPKVARGAAPKHVILFVMDSLRADRVKVWNPKARPEVPNFEKLAQTSAVFLQHYVQGNESRVSHASLWSSLYPIKHAMIPADAKLGLNWTTIDEVAKAAGLYVAGASANGYVEPKRWGFGTKWDAYSNHIHEALGLKAEDIVEKGLKFVGGKADPWFLYVGTVDTHVSWRAKEPWIEQYNPGYNGRFAKVFSGADAAAAATGAKLTEAETKHVRALYDSNVSYQDKVLGDLIAKLEAEGRWQDTMLIITADHGDEQWEDGRVGHGASTRDMLVHVPLLIHYPPLLPAGKYAAGTELIDVVPTMADALGQPIDPEWQGQSLIPLATGVDGPYGRLSMTSQYEDAHAGRLGDWKARTSGGGAPRIYDLAADPDELSPVTPVGGAAIGARTVLDPLWLLRTHNAEWKKSAWGNPANVTARFAQDLGE